MQSKDAKNNPLLLQQLREQAMDKRLQEIISEVENDVANIDPKDIPQDFEEMDPKLYQFLKKHAYKEPPNYLKEKVLKAVFEKKGSDQINYKRKDLGGSIFTIVQSQMKLGYVGIVLLLIIIGGIYYKNSSKINLGDITSNQQTPTININSNPIATITPNPEVTPTPNIAENSSKKDTTTKSNQKIVSQKKIPKPDLHKDLERDNDKIALNKPNNNQSDLIRDITSENNEKKGVTLSELIYVDVLPLHPEKENPSIIDLEIEKELKTTIGNNNKWKLVIEEKDKAKTQAVFMKQKKDGALILVNKDNKVLWKDENYIENYKKDKGYIKSVINLLTENK